MVTDVLRVIDSVGSETGIQVRLTPEIERAATRSSTDDGGDNQVATVVGLTLLAICAKAKAMVKRMLRRGPPSRLLDSVCPDKDSNVLRFTMVHSYGQALLPGYGRDARQISSCV